MKRYLNLVITFMLLLGAVSLVSCSDDVTEGPATGNAQITATDADGNAVDIIAFSSDNSDNSPTVVHISARNAAWNARVESLGNTTEGTAWLDMTVDRTGNTITVVPVGNNDNDESNAARIVVYDQNNVAKNVTIIVAQKGQTYGALSVRQEDRDLEFQALKRDNPEPTVIYVTALDVNWNARTEEGDSSDWFEYEVDTEKSLLVVRVTGNNLTDNPYTGEIVIFDENGIENDISISLTQLNDNGIDLLVTVTALYKAADAEMNLGQYAIRAGDEGESSDDVVEGATLYWVDQLWSNVIFTGVNYWDARIPEGTYTVAYGDDSTPFTMPEGVIRQLPWGEDYTNTWVFRNENVNGNIEMIPYRINQGTLDISYDGEICHLYYELTSEDGTVFRAIYDDAFTNFRNVVAAPFNSKLETNVTVDVSHAAMRYFTTMDYNPGYWQIYLMEEGVTYEQQWGMDRFSGDGGYISLIFYDDNYSNDTPSADIPTGEFEFAEYVLNNYFYSGSTTVGNLGAGSWYWSSVDMETQYESPYAPIIAGTVNISKTDDNYTLQLKGWDDTWTMRGGQYQINCNYTGLIYNVTP